MLGLGNDWMGMWMEYVLQWVQLQAIDLLDIARGQGQKWVLVRTGKSRVVCGR